MFIYLFSIVIIVISNLVYHISQKSTPEKLNPFLTLFITYIVATIITGLLLIFVKPDKGFSNSLKDVKWTAFALGVAIVGLEVGYLIAYRSGWNISLCSLVSNTTVALLLIPIGFLFYGEHIPPLKMIGIILSITGLVFIYLK